MSVDGIVRPDANVRSLSLTHARTQKLLRFAVKSGGILDPRASSPDLPFASSSNVRNGVINSGAAMAHLGWLADIVT